MQAYILQVLSTLLLSPQGYDRGLPSFIVYVLFGLLAGIALFLLMREVYCWYFKINKRVELLESINAKLAAQAQNKSSLEETEKQI